MAEPTIADIFPGATQTAESLVIPKASLATLTAVGINRGDALSVAILLTIGRYYTEARRIGDTDVSIVAEREVDTIELGLNPGSTSFFVKNLTFRAYQAYSTQSLAADDFESIGGPTAPPVPIAPPTTDLGLIFSSAATYSPAPRTSTVLDGSSQQTVNLPTTDLQGDWVAIYSVSAGAKLVPPSGQLINGAAEAILPNRGSIIAIRRSTGWVSVALSDLSALAGAIAGKLDATAVGQAGGAAALDSGGKVPIIQIPTLSPAKITGLDPVGVTAGHVLAASGGAIVWAAPSGGGGGSSVNLIAVGSNTTLAVGQSYVAIAPNITLSLPSATGLADGTLVEVQNAATAAITVGGNSLKAGGICRAIVVGGAWVLRSWATTPTRAIVLTPGSGTYVDGQGPPDTSDFFYLAGTNFGAISWQAPHGFSVNTFFSSLVNSAASGLTSRTAGLLYTANTSGSYALLDLAFNAANRKLAPSYLRFQHGGNDGTHRLTSLRARATNTLESFDSSGVSSAIWTTLQTWSLSLSSTGFAWSPLLAFAPSDPYRYLLLDSLNQTSSGNWYFMMGELLLWGAVYE